MTTSTPYTPADVRLLAPQKHAFNETVVVGYHRLLATAEAHAAAKTLVENLKVTDSLKVCETLDTIRHLIEVTMAEDDEGEADLAATLERVASLLSSPALAPLTVVVVDSLTAMGDPSFGKPAPLAAQTDTTDPHTGRRTRIEGKLRFIGEASQNRHPDNAWKVVGYRDTKAGAAGLGYGYGHTFDAAVDDLKKQQKKGS